MFRPAPHVVFEVVQEEAVLLDGKRGQYFGLNDVGLAVWERLQSGASERDLIATVMQRFDVDPETCAADLDELLASLIAAGLITKEE